MNSTTELKFDARINHAPTDYKADSKFADFFLPIHREFTPRQQALAAKRSEILENSNSGNLPDYLAASEAATDWKIEVPKWCERSAQSDDRTGG